MVLQCTSVNSIPPAQEWHPRGPSFHRCLFPIFIYLFQIKFSAFQIAKRYIPVYITLSGPANSGRNQTMMLTTLLRLFFSLALLFSMAASAFAGELNISAASSLTNAFKDIAQSYQASIPRCQGTAQFRGVWDAAATTGQRRTGRRLSDCRSRNDGRR